MTDAEQHGLINQDHSTSFAARCYEKHDIFWRCW